MILWTIQHKNAYENMMKNGRSVADETSMYIPDIIGEAYIWMANKMKEFIGDPPESVRFPVWAWYQWEGLRKRPDMRSHRFYGEKGTPIVLLTVEVPDEKVVLSDFDMWHCILNDDYLPLTVSDDKDEFTNDEKIFSWNNVFKYDIETDLWNTPKSTQATMWEIKKEWVLKVEHFVSR